MEEIKKFRPEPGGIFTDGAHCEPFEWTDPTTGEKMWRWIVVSFEGDSYMGGEYVDPASHAKTRTRLMNEIKLD